MALMGLHYFHGAPQLGCSRGCRLIELDEWTVTWPEQVDPPLPPPRPLLTPNSHMHANAQAHTNADMHTDRCTYTSSSTESVYSCKVKHGKEETNYPPDRWLGMWEAWSFFLPRFETLLLSAADSQSPPPQPCVYGTVHLKRNIVWMLRLRCLLLCALVRWCERV